MHATLIVYLCSSNVTVFLLFLTISSIFAALYSRGKSQILRLAVPIHILLQLLEQESQSQDEATYDDNSDEQMSEEVLDDIDLPQNDEESNDENEDVDEPEAPELDGEEDEEFMEKPLPPIIIDGQIIDQQLGNKSIQIATSLVNSSIKQLCKYFILHYFINIL